MAASCRAEGPRNLQRRSAPASALDRQEHDLRPPDVLLRRVSVVNERMKPIEIGRGDGKRNAGSHPADWHAANPQGILSGIQSLDLIH
jgi:hypothetical protein